VVSKGPFRSRAYNGEDVIVWRALGAVSDGRYVDAGASGPTSGSLTAALAEQGWKGIEIPAGEVLDRRLDDVLAEHGLLDQRVHLLAVDAGGEEARALASLDLRRVRPVVLMVRDVPPGASGTRASWEPAVLAAGYRPCLFTGLFRVYVAVEDDDRIGAALSYPACVLDDATRAGAPADDRLARTEQELIRWRALAMSRWDEAANGTTPTSVAWEVDRLHHDLDAMRRTLSWRITRPIRIVRRLLANSTVRRAASALRGGR
jgi:pimeloyl-ACP methyl ester carboxylesterase